MTEFKFDLEKSKAEFVVTPMETPSGIFYRINAFMELKPYPNPLSYGGYWQAHDTPDLNVVEAIRENFKQDVKKFGLIQVVIKENPVKRAEQQLKLEGSFVGSKNIREVSHGTTYKRTG